MSDDREKPHPLQRLLDNPWLLLLIGLAVTFISYFTWGWIDLSNVGPAQLP